MTRRTSALIAPLLAICLCLAACTDAALQKAAKAIDGVASANDALAKTIIAEQANGTISESDARLILNGVCAKVSSAVIVTANLTQQYTTFPAGAKVTIAPLLQPILDAISQALATGITGIKNAQVKANIQTSLQLVQTGMLAAQAAIGGN